ncbi:DUF3397 domain-containing protein [Bacillus coahuilensis]|uniref:DUF3397 domain-containing protein n=1 Tax=Bacillus coahuilensis TaxID=408580 RepID=UPI003B834EBC
MTIDVMTIMIILSVHFIILSIWKESYLSYIFLCIFVVGFIFVIFYYRKKQELVIRKVLRSFWRINFFLFSLAYIFLIFFGIGKKIVEAI